MTYGGREARTGIGVALGVKLGATALLILAASGLNSGGPGRESGVPRVALAAEPATGAGAQSDNAAKEHAQPAKAEQIHGDVPSLEFAQQSRAVAELLEAIRHRSEELAKREAALKQRETTMTAAASDLEKKIARLEALTAAASGGGAAGGNAPGTGKGPGGAPAPSSMEELGKIYGAMKAEESAPLLNRLDNETVRAIFAHMKQKQISAVLPLMNPDKAVELTKLLGGRE